MKTFLAIYLGSDSAQAQAAWNRLDESARNERIAKGMQAWHDWGARHASAIVDQGGPLGKTKRAAADGVSDVRNAVTGYVLVRAESHDAAAKMFVGHPHFAIFPGDSVEIMECLPVPGM
jgi:hypothetical protein